tara:strand:+ start:346 stop:921 length:576 start_codon:yes stop_codon:yes gene_type:complete
MIIFIKKSILFIYIFLFFSCDENRYVKSFRAPKKNFGLNQQNIKPVISDSNLSGLSWDLPSTWVPSKGHSMRLASFDIPFSNGVGDLSIVSLGGESGGLLANVNRWRKQINLVPITENEILSLSTKGESKIGPYRVFKMINESNINKAILAAVLPTTGKTFYIKLTASITGVAELELVFQKFCSSIGFLKN